MFTSMQLAHSLNEALRVAPQPPPAPGLLAPRRDKARLHCRGALVRLRAEMAVAVAHPERWRIVRLPHRLGYRLQHEMLSAHITLTMIDENTLAVEMLARRPSSRALPLGPSAGISLVNLFAEWVRELVVMGAIQSTTHGASSTA